MPQAARAASPSLALGILVGFWNWELFPRRVFGVGNWLRAGPMGTIVVLDLMGGVALLLWGLHMVRSGVLRAFGPDLRRFLSKALGNRFGRSNLWTGKLRAGPRPIRDSQTMTGQLGVFFSPSSLVG